jgi:hypothetical protein
MTDGVHLSLETLDPSKINESYTHQLWGTTFQLKFNQKPRSPQTPPILQTPQLSAHFSSSASIFSLYYIHHYVWMILFVAVMVFLEVLYQSTDL